MECWRKLATDCIAGLLRAFDLNIVLVPHVCSAIFSINQDDELLLKAVHERLPGTCKRESRLRRAV